MCGVKSIYKTMILAALAVAFTASCARTVSDKVEILRGGGTRRTQVKDGGVVLIDEYDEYRRGTRSIIKTPEEIIVRDHITGETSTIKPQPKPEGTLKK